MQETEFHNILLRTAGLIHQMRKEIENLADLSSQPLLESTAAHSLRQGTNRLDESLQELSRLWTDLPDKAQEPQVGKTSFDPSIILREETEYQRLAGALGEGPAQLLANAVVELDSTLPLVQAPPQVEEGLRELRDELNDCLGDLRWLIWQLQPPSSLKDLGLGPALQQFTQRFQERTGIATRLEGLQRLPQGLPYMLELSTFRIVQEALGNVYRHAEAAEVTVAVTEGDEALEISVEDNGQGFRERLPSRSLGLVGMQDRADLIGAALNIRSSPGRGTRVTLRIPYSQLGVTDSPRTTDKAEAPPLRGEQEKRH